MKYTVITLLVLLLAISIRAEVGSGTSKSGSIDISARPKLLRLYEAMK